MPKRDFLTLLDFSPEELFQIVRRGIQLKAMRRQCQSHELLTGRVLAMVFEKSSTRTRVSFEAGMMQLGGNAIFLSPNDTQLGRGERIEDTAKVLSGMVDGIMVRTFEHEKLVRFAEAASVPVINGLTDGFHPCQLLADMQTYFEKRGSIEGKTVAWVGDGNNMCHSYINGARQYNFYLKIAAPEPYFPSRQVLSGASSQIRLCASAEEAVKEADLVVTDVWASMGQENQAQARRDVFQAFQVDERLMSLAKPDALFMHCLPAHRGEEVTAGVIDGAQSVVWDEAENRLHAQKALLEFLLS